MSSSPPVFSSSSLDSSATVLAPAADDISAILRRNRAEDLEKAGGDSVPISEEHYAASPPAQRTHHFRGIARYFKQGGKLQPFRLLRQDVRNLRRRYKSDWTVFNQLVLASAVYVFFTNILPGITFASDLYVLTGHSWGTIEVVFSTGLCGIIFAS